jgi:hypothetical protein
MNNRRNMLIIVIALITALLFAAFASAQTSSSDAENLLGSWDTTVKTVIQDSTFSALLTFDAGGAVLADEPGALGETTGHGNWEMTGEGQVALTFISLFSDGTVYTGKLKVVAALEWDDSAHTWSGDFKIDVFDPDNAVIAGDTGTFTLTRIEVESLD